MKTLAVRTTIILTAFALFVGFISTTAQAAPTGLYLSPSSGTYAKDSEFVVQVRLGNSDADGVQSNIDFDITKLQIVQVLKAGSPFTYNNTAYNNLTGDISTYAISGNGSGDRLVTTITFRAINSGTTALTFAGTNKVHKNSSWIDIATNNASYTISAPPAPPAPPSSSGTSSGSSAKTNTPPAATTNPVAEKNESPTATESKRKQADEFKTTDSNEKSQKSYSSQNQAINTENKPSSWLATLIAGALGLLSFGIFLAYRRTHISHSLRRLIVTVISYRIALSENKSSLRIAIMSKAIPAFTALKSPKLLAAGIKRKLLAAGNKFSSSQR